MIKIVATCSIIFRQNVGCKSGEQIYFNFDGANVRKKHIMIITTRNIIYYPNLYYMLFFQLWLFNHFILPKMLLNNLYDVSCLPINYFSFISMY